MKNYQQTTCSNNSTIFDKTLPIISTKQEVQELQVQIKQQTLRIKALESELLISSEYIERIHEDYENALYHFKRQTKPKIN